jgi:hypothetical protein
LAVITAYNAYAQDPDINLEELRKNLETEKKDFKIKKDIFVYKVEQVNKFFKGYTFGAEFSKQYDRPHVKPNPGMTIPEIDAAHDLMEVMSNQVSDDAATLYHKLCTIKEMDSQLQSSSFTPDQYQELFTSLSGYQNKH